MTVGEFCRQKKHRQTNYVLSEREDGLLLVHGSITKICLQFIQISEIENSYQTNGVRFLLLTNMERKLIFRVIISIVKCCPCNPYLE